MSDENKDTNTGATNPDAANSTSTPKDAIKEGIEATKTHVRQAAEELRAAAEAKARELRDVAEAKARELRESASHKAGEFRDKAEHAYTDARQRVRTWQDEGEDYVRQNPLKAVVGALCAGFVLGLIIRK